MRRGNYEPDQPTRAQCCKCSRRATPLVLFAAPTGWKRIADALGRAVYICDRCR